MSRSVWKGNYISQSFFRLSHKKKRVLKVWDRASSIPYNMINKNILVYTGKEFKKIFITREKVGYKFGEFCFTRLPKKSLAKKTKKMQLKNVQNSVLTLQKNHFLQNFKLKENFLLLCKSRKLYASNVEVSNIENIVYVTGDFFFTTSKISRLTNKLGFKRLSRKRKNKNKKKKINTILFNKNFVIRAKLLNLYVDDKYVEILFKDLKKFNPFKSLFNRRYTMFYDFIKITSLAVSNRNNFKLFASFIALIFKNIHKKKHNLFFSFLRYLMNFMTTNKKEIVGIKVILNGRISGKLRANSVKIQKGRLSINNIRNKPLSSKTHIYTTYGVYGIYMLGNYKEKVCQERQSIKNNTRDQNQTKLTTTSLLRKKIKGSSS